MRCSKCGSPDHNVRTCPYRDQDVPRNRALWVKVDNLTEREEADLLSGIVKLKKKVFATLLNCREETKWLRRETLLISEHKKLGKKLISMCAFYV